MGWDSSEVVIFDLASVDNLVTGGNELVSGGNDLVKDGYDWKHKDLLSYGNHLVTWWPWAPSSRANEVGHN